MARPFTRTIEPLLGTETFPQLIESARVWTPPLRTPSALRRPLMTVSTGVAVTTVALLAATFPDLSSASSALRVWGWMAPSLLVVVGLGVGWATLTVQGRRRVINFFEPLVRVVFAVLLLICVALACCAALAVGSTGVHGLAVLLGFPGRPGLLWSIAAFFGVLTAGTFSMAVGCRQALMTSRLEPRSADGSVLSAVVGLVTLVWGAALFIAIARFGVPALGVLLTGFSLVAGALGRYAFLAHRQRAQSVGVIVSTLERFEAAYVHSSDEQLRQSALEIRACIGARGAFGQKILPWSTRAVVLAIAAIVAEIRPWGDSPFDGFLRGTLEGYTWDQAAALLAEAASHIRLRLEPLR